MTRSVRLQTAATFLAFKETVDLGTMQEVAGVADYALFVWLELLKACRSFCIRLDLINYRPVLCL